MKTHRCRRSCDRQVDANKAFCGPCWAQVPRRVQVAIYASWNRVLKNEGDDAYGSHLELLTSAESALEGERPWEAVAA